MTRLIDADEIPWFVEGIGDIPVVTREEIEEMPTIDAVPVIMCKDCKHYDIQVQQCTCEADWFGIEPNGFCSRAERKEE